MTQPLPLAGKKLEAVSCRTDLQVNDLYKTQMGTIIADSSHFTALHRNLMQCQVTVMLAGFLSLIHALQQRVRKCCPDPSLRVCYHLDSGWSVVLPKELLPGEVLADGAPS